MFNLLASAFQLVTKFRVAKMLLDDLEAVGRLPDAENLVGVRRHREDRGRDGHLGVRARPRLIGGPSLQGRAEMDPLRTKRRDISNPLDSSNKKLKFFLCSNNENKIFDHSMAAD